MEKRETRERRTARKKIERESKKTDMHKERMK